MTGVKGWPGRGVHAGRARSASSGLVLALILGRFVFGLGHLYQGTESAVSSGFTGVLLALIFL